MTKLYDSKVDFRCHASERAVWEKSAADAGLGLQAWFRLLGNAASGNMQLHAQLERAAEAARSAHGQLMANAKRQSKCAHKLVLGKRGTQCSDCGKYL